MKYDVQHNMTLQECADEMNVSFQRVDELQRRALKKIKKALLEKFGDKITLEDLLPITKEDYLP